MRFLESVSTRSQLARHGCFLCGNPKQVVDLAVTVENEGGFGLCTRHIKEVVRQHPDLNLAEDYDKLMEWGKALESACKSYIVQLGHAREELTLLRAQIEEKERLLSHRNTVTEQMLGDAVCPECGWTGSEKGLKIHKTRVHREEPVSAPTSPSSVSG